MQNNLFWKLMSKKHLQVLWKIITKIFIFEMGGL